MNIAISLRSQFNQSGNTVDSLEYSYQTYFQNFGVNLLPVCNLTERVDYLVECNISGIVLIGGGDVDPLLYGQEPDDRFVISKERDATERKLLDLAISHRIPVLGICRGFQFINVYFGGKLLHYIREKPHFLDHLHTTHEVQITDPSVADFLHRRSLIANSFHNHALTRQELASCLMEFAQTRDGVIEGLFHRAYPIAAIMWHPERKYGDDVANHELLQCFLQKNLLWNERKS